MTERMVENLLLIASFLTIILLTFYCCATTVEFRNKKFWFLKALGVSLSMPVMFPIMVSIKVTLFILGIIWVCLTEIVNHLRNPLTLEEWKQEK